MADKGKKVAKSHQLPRPASSPPGTSQRESLEESFKTKMSVGAADAQPRSTGAVAKKTYKTRHPTDPLPSQNGDVRPKSPRRPSVDKKRTLSSSDSHLLGQSSSSRASGSISPLSHSPVTPTHKKPTLSQGGAGMSASQQKIHILLSSSHSALVGSNDGTQQPLNAVGEDAIASILATPKKHGDTAENPANTKKTNFAKPSQAKGQRTPKKESKPFEPYMMLDQVQQGMKKGDLIEGVLRINPKNFQDAYISVPDERTDIYVCGIRDRNRSLNGDVVVVQLKPMEQWKVLFSDLSKYIEKHNLGNASLTANPMSKATREVLMTIERNLKLRANGSTPSPKPAPAQQQSSSSRKGLRRKRGKKKKISKLTDHLEIEENVQPLSFSDHGAPAIIDDAQDLSIISNDIRVEKFDLLPEVVAVDASSNSQVPSESLPTEGPVKDLQFLEFPVIDNFQLPDSTLDSTPMSTVHNWNAEAASAQVAIIQLADLLSDAPGAIQDLDSLVDDLVAADQYGDESGATGFIGLAKVVVAPDELSEAEDSVSSGSHSHCSNEIHQVVEDNEFFAANFSSGEPSVNGALEVAADSSGSTRHGNKGLDKRFDAKLTAAKGGSPMDSEEEEFLEDRYFPVSASSQSHLFEMQGNELSFDGPSTELDAVTRDSWNRLLVEPLETIAIKDLIEMPNAHLFIQKTATVVYISEEVNSRLARGHLKPMPDKNRNWTLFVPTDHRFPRMMIPARQCPPDFFNKHQAYAQELFIARLESWTDGSFARGFLCNSLGPVGNLGVETMGILVENDVRFGEFDDNILSVLPKVPWTIPEEELSYRRDFRDVCVFTIDPATARDLDDAVSCDDLGGGLFRVTVHIADVSFFLREGTPLDAEAIKRATSIYMVQEVIPMLPRLLCEELCSLQPNEDRLAFSVQWTIREDGAILDEWFGRTVINSCVKLAYEHAQLAIDVEDDQVAAAGLPSIHGGRWTKFDVISRIRTLHSIAVHLRRKRAERGNLHLDQIKINFSLDRTTGLPTSYHAHVQRESNKLIEEFMLLANMAVAHRIYRTYPTLAILRCHPPPQERKLEEVLTTLEPYGIILDGTSSDSLQKSLERYDGADAMSRSRMLVIMGLLTKPMNRAKYFCSGQMKDEVQFLHYALNVPLYTHFTSPIRRYADVMVHRLLAADLGYLERPSGKPAHYAKVAGNCNTQKQIAKLVQEQSDALFLAAYVNHVGGFSESAMVCAILDRSFDVQLLSVGTVKRIYCEQLPLLKMEFSASNGVPRLILIFKPRREGEQPLTMTIMLFTMVEVVLKSTPGSPLKFDAHLKLP